MIALFKRIIVSLYFLTLFTGTLFIDFQNHSAAYANNSGFNAITSVEVASLFYKMTNQEPQFKKWAETSKAYHQAPEYDKEAILKQEEIRLREIFYNVFTDELINVQIQINMRNYSEIQEKLFFGEISADTFFAYGAFGENFALIAPGIEQYSSMSLSKEATESIEKQSGGVAVAEFTLKPVRAEKSAPIPIDESDYWSILCEVAAFRLWNKDRTILFNGEYKDWYRPDSNLLDLYKKQ